MSLENLKLFREFYFMVRDHSSCKSWKLLDTNEIAKSRVSLEKLKLFRELCIVVSTLLLIYHPHSLLILSSELGTIEPVREAMRVIGP